MGYEATIGHSHSLGLQGVRAAARTPYFLVPLKYRSLAT